MKYLIELLVLAAITFILIFISTFNIANSTLKEKVKRSWAGIILMLPIISLIGGIFFLLFQLVVMLLGVNIYFLDVFIIGLYGVLILFVGDFLSKIIISNVTSGILSRKYSAEELTEKEMFTIYESHEKTIKIWSYILMFLISLLIYTVIMKLSVNEINTMFIGIISLINTLGYILFFRRKTSVVAE